MSILNLALVTLLWLGTGSLEPATLRFVDDLGREVRGPLEVCVAKSHGLSQTCSPLDADSRELTVDDFGWVRVEGPEHGPVSFRRTELQRVDGRENQHGVFRVTVPRKATLRLKGLSNAGQTLTLSLFDQDDAFFRQPAFREVVEQRELKIPSGSYLASFRFSESAPDLRLLEVEPGGSYSVEPRRLPGWSLVIRTIDSDGQPVRSAALEVTASPGFDQVPGGPRQLPKTASSNSRGLAVLSGLAATIATSKAEHPHYFTESTPALSATPGTFAFVETVLKRGGTVKATVTVEGEAIAGGECILHHYAGYQRGPREDPIEMSRAPINPLGACRSKRILGGEYVLRVNLPEQLVGPGATLEKPVSVVENEELELAVDLQRFRIEGTVYQGDESAPGFTVAIYSRETPKPNATEIDAVVRTETGPTGKYDLTLWGAGRYSVFVTKNGTPAAVKEVSLQDGDVTVDFRLAAQEITGVVVDDRGKALGEAMVMLRWQHHSHRLARTGDDGTFTFAVDGESGPAEVEALKMGYRTVEAVQIALSPESSLAPLRLVLRRRSAVVGVLRYPSRQPMFQGWVQAYSLLLFENPKRVGNSDSDLEGNFETSVSKETWNRLFFGGPGCPLGSRDLPPGFDETLNIVCQQAPSNLEIELLDIHGAPVRGASILLRRGDVIVPREVLMQHLLRIGTNPVTDGAGRLFLVGLEPGDYDLFLAGVTSPVNIAAGLTNGYLLSTSLQPLSTETVKVTIETKISR